MKKSLSLFAVLASLILLTAFSAQAAEAAEYVGKGVVRFVSPTKASQAQSQLLISTSTIKHGEIEEPLGQGRRKDTTSAGIGKSMAEPKQNTPEKANVERPTTVAAKQEQKESKFSIYGAIKESVLDFIFPSRKDSAKPTPKVDLSKVQKDGRTEHPVSKAQPLVK